MVEPTDTNRPSPASRNWRRTAAPVVALGVVGGLILSVPGADAAPGAAPGAAPAPVARTTPAADSPAPAKPRAGETYQERQERIARSTRPMLPTAADDDPDTTCVSGEFTTLSVVYDSIVESLLPSLPPQLRPAAQASLRDVAGAMKNIHVSTLAVSNHPSTRGADRDDPQYRTAISQVIVDGLLKIRDGEADDAIAVENITLSQAVETAWLYVFAGVLAPAKFGLALVPGLGSPLTGAPAPVNTLAQFVTYNQLLTLGLTGVELGLQTLYQNTGNAILNQCVARVTDEQKDAAGRPSEDVSFDIPIPAIIENAARQLALADADTCPPIGDLSLGDIVQRTGDQAADTAPNAAAKRRIEREVASIRRALKSAPIPHNLIPTDKADFSEPEKTASFIGGLLPFIGGAPLDVAIGLGHAIGAGEDLGEIVTADELTVTKSLTAAYYSYALSLHLFSNVGGMLVDPVQVFTGTNGVGALNPVRVIAAVLGLPLTYGLVTFHHVVRTMCFADMDATGTGLGAEANKKAPEVHAESVARKRSQR